MRLFSRRYICKDCGRKGRVGNKGSARTMCPQCEWNNDASQFGSDAYMKAAGFTECQLTESERLAILGKRESLLVSLFWWIIGGLRRRFKR